MQGITFKHMSLVFILIIMYLGVLGAFYLTWAFVRTSGTIPSFFISCTITFAVFVIGTMGFWKIVIKLSQESKHAN